jgi:hypothetical protein
LFQDCPYDTFRRHYDDFVINSDDEYASLCIPKNPQPTPTPASLNDDTYLSTLAIAIIAGMSGVLMILSVMLWTTRKQLKLVQSGTSIGYERV